MEHERPKRRRTAQGAISSGDMAKIQLCLRIKKIDENATVEICRTQRVLWQGPELWPTSEEALLRSMQTGEGENTANS